MSEPCSPEVSSSRRLREGAAGQGRCRRGPPGQHRRCAGIPAPPSEPETHRWRPHQGPVKRVSPKVGYQHWPAQSHSCRSSLAVPPLDPPSPVFKWDPDPTPDPVCGLRWTSPTLAGNPQRFPAWNLGTEERTHPAGPKEWGL